MASIIGNYFGNLALTNILTINSYLALHQGDPGLTGSSSTECVGGSYGRIKITWSPPSNKTTTNTNQLVYGNLPYFYITYLVVWDAPTNGNLLIRFPMPENVLIQDGQGFIVLPSDITVTL